MRRIDIEGLEKRSLLLLTPIAAGIAVDVAQEIRHRKDLSREQIIVIACRLLSGM
jgi:hypothetical protein